MQAWQIKQSLMQKCVESEFKNVRRSSVTAALSSWAAHADTGVTMRVHKRLEGFHIDKELVDRVTATEADVTGKGCHG